MTSLWTYDHIIAKRHLPSYFGIFGLKNRSGTTQAGRSRVRIPVRLMGYFFNWPSPSRPTMTLGFTQPPTEMSARDLHGEKSAADAWGWQYHGNELVDCLETVGASMSHNAMCRHGLYNACITCTCTSYPTRLWRHDRETGHEAGMEELWKGCRITPQRQKGIVCHRDVHARWIIILKLFLNE
jgi:hypothetical protein